MEFNEDGTVKLKYKEIDGIFYPDVTTYGAEPEEKPEPTPEPETVPIHHTMIMFYGRNRLDYLEENKPSLFKQLKLSGELESHALNLQIQAVEREQEIVKQMLEIDPGPKLEVDQMGWVGHRNMTRLQAQEIVLREMIYV